MSDKDYGATLNLPKTSFQMKANLPNKEPKFIKNVARAGDLFSKKE